MIVKTFENAASTRKAAIKNGHCVALVKGACLTQRNKTGFVLAGADVFHDACRDGCGSAAVAYQCADAKGGLYGAPARLSDIHRDEQAPGAILFSVHAASA